MFWILRFRFYLRNRAFSVSLNNMFSEARTINCGVTQGSIIGPLLFLLYIDNIPQALQIVGHICMGMTITFFINVSTLQKSKIFQAKNLRMYPNVLLIIDLKFIFVEIKLNAFFSVRRKL